MKSRVIVLIALFVVIDAAIARKQNDDSRAFGASMEGRGYTVK